MNCAPSVCRTPRCGWHRAGSGRRCISPSRCGRADQAETPRISPRRSSKLRSAFAARLSPETLSTTGRSPARGGAAGGAVTGRPAHHRHHFLAAGAPRVELARERAVAQAGDLVRQHQHLVEPVRYRSRAAVRLHPANVVVKLARPAAAGQRGRLTSKIRSAPRWRRRGRSGRAAAAPWRGWRPGFGVVLSSTRCRSRAASARVRAQSTVMRPPGAPSRMFGDGQVGHRADFTGRDGDAVAARASLGLWNWIGRPSTRISPALGRESDRRCCVVPAPFSPMIEWTSPARSFRRRPSAWTGRTIWRCRALER